MLLIRRSGSFAEPAVALAAALSGDLPYLGALDTEDARDTVLKAAAANGVESLLRLRINEAAGWSSVPAAVRDALDARARDAAAGEGLRFAELRRIFAKLRQVGVRALVFKGAALAYTHYPAPYLRPRCDTDLLVQREDRERAVDAFVALGYHRLNSVGREAVHTQWTLERRTISQLHFIDLHWKLSNRPLFASMLTFDELEVAAVAIPRLGDGAFTLTPVHALLLACIHRVSHDDSERLIWLYDIKLLADGLSPGEWEEFRRLAIRKQVVGLCARSLELMAARLGCSVAISQQVSSIGVTASPRERSLGYLGSPSSLRSLVLDVKASKGLATKAILVASHLFPDAAYMRKAHRVTSDAALPAIYAQRAARGIWRLLSKATF